MRGRNRAPEGGEPMPCTPELERVRRAGAGSSPLRRSGAGRGGAGHEERNDDDAERSLLVASERTPDSNVATSTPRSTISQDVTSSPQKEHFQGCLKLYAENKINKDNAWNLQLIDFMSSMLRRHDSRMENLQLASTVVDASTRIYSFRVDAVHHEVMKMAGGFAKAAQAKRGKRDEDGTGEAGEGAVDGEGPTQARKKKKKSRGAIAANPQVLNGDFDANECLDPFFERLAATAGDVTSSNRCFNATLPINDQTLALILRMDEPFIVANKENIPEDLVLTEKISIPLKMLRPFSADDEICEPFTNFSISNWDPDTEDSENRVTNWVEENRLNLSQQALAFDVNAEVEPVPLDDNHNDLLDDEPLGGIESDEEQEAALVGCVPRAPPVPLARLTDMRPVSNDHRLEYSYCSAIVSAWAGPSHWRLKNNRASKTLAERTQNSGGRQSEPSRRPARNKRQLDFVGAGAAFQWKAEGDYAVPQPNKIMISRKTLSQGQAWSEKNYKTPIDRGLDETHFQKLFLKKSVVLLLKKDRERQAERSGLARGGDDSVHLSEPHDYDYNNENDTAYCPNSQHGAEEAWGNEEGAAAGDVHQQLKSTEHEELGDMLEPPIKVAKIFIPYAMRAKKVDMKQLKHCTWRLLVDKSADDGHRKVDPTTFSTIFNRLPDKLSNTMQEALSVPLALLSVLHLANEKGLILEKHEDNKDFGILGLIE